MTRLAVLLDNYMAHKGLTLREVADDIGINHVALFRLLKGKTLNVTNLLTVMTWLTETIDE